MMFVINRRRFLKQAFLWTGCGLVLPLCRPLKLQAADTKNSLDRYYLLKRDLFLKNFQETNEGAKAWLSTKYDPQLANHVASEAYKHFEELEPNLPPVGGDGNPDTKYLVVAAWYLAFYRPMKAEGLTAEDVGRMIYDLNAIALSDYPKEKVLAQGAQRFTPQSLNEMKKWAEWTQKRGFPANWVAEFLVGDGQDFDFGYNYSECGVVKYLQSHNAADVAPFVCLNDFLRSKTFGTGLQRKGTLAQKDKLCDFRYKKGRQVNQSWDTEIQKIRTVIKMTKEAHGVNGGAMG